MQATALALCLLWRPGAAGEDTPKAKRLYDEFEALNTPENLDWQFVGGQPPQFVRRQIELLQAIAARPAGEAVPILLRVSTEHLERLEAVGAARLRKSPLQAIQVPLITALGRHAARDDVRTALGRLANAPLIKEYARGRALDLLVERYLERISDAEDPKGERRAKVLLDTLIGNLTLPEILHAPGRLRAVARRAPDLPKADATGLWRALAEAAHSPAQRYAVDVALGVACAQKEAAGKPLAQEEKDLLVEACGRWLKEFRPVAAKEKYPSDLLGESFLRLGIRLEYEPLSRLLREGGILPAKP